MGIKGTVRRNQDGHFIHANIDLDIIITEEVRVLTKTVGTYTTVDCRKLFIVSLSASDGDRGEMRIGVVGFRW